MSTAITESGATYLLTLRSERPIEGCELSPNAFLQLKGGALDNLSRSKLLESVPYYYSYSWHRGPRKQICSSHRCPRGNTFEPIHWSKAALGGPELVCSVCEKSGKPGYESSFCSVQCFKESWAQHSKCHPVLQKHAVLQQKIDEYSSEAPSPVPEEDDESSVMVDNKELVDQRSVAEWISIFKEKTYIPTHEDVGCRLRIEVSALSVADNSVLCGPIEIFTEPVLSNPSAPPKRRLLAIPGAVTGNLASSVRFRVVSYNILAEIYATKQAYPYCDAWNLSWPYRRKVILDELEETQGDVVCLQEVQADYYEQHVNPMMKELGYDGLFKPKSRECTGQYGKVDGCATFWKRSKFILAENYSIEFNDLARQEAVSMGMDDAEARKFMNRLSRDNIAQIIILEAMVPRPPGSSRSSRHNVCLVNTHLYSNHQRADVKLWQSVSLMREVQQFVTQRDLALILCGDFNSEPSSAVYEYMVTGGISPSHPDLVVGHNNLRILPADSSLITHNIEMTSAMYSAIGEEPAFTNYTANFKGTLDYIFYTPSRLRIMAVSNLPEEHEIRATSGEGLPSTSYPSDHLMLCVDMIMTMSGSGSIVRHSMQQQQGGHHHHHSNAGSLSASKNKNSYGRGLNSAK